MKIKNLVDSQYDKLVFKFRKNLINISYQVIKQYRLLTFYTIYTSTYIWYNTEALKYVILFGYMSFYLANKCT